MESLRQAAQEFLGIAVDAVKKIEEEKVETNNRATLLIIDDAPTKAKELFASVRGRPWTSREKFSPLPITVHHEMGAGEGLAFTKIYLNQQDIIEDEAQNAGKDTTHAPFIIAMDGSLPIRQNDEKPEQSMGYQTTEDIIKFCRGSEGDEEHPIPYFIGYSMENSSNKGLQRLLEKYNASDKYLGQYTDNEAELRSVLDNLVTNTAKIDNS